MSDGVKIEITGVKELQAKFERMSFNLVTAVSRAMDEGEKIVETSAKSKVRVKTGNLKNSIEEKNRSLTSTTISIDIGTDVDYAAHQEYGTRKLSAQPFLRPALDENSNAIQAKIEAAIKSALGGL